MSQLKSLYSDAKMDRGSIMKRRITKIRNEET
jgi:hypothetical protein